MRAKLKSNQNEFPIYAMHFAVILKTLLRTFSLKTSCHLVKVLRIVFSRRNFRIKTHVNISSVQNSDHILYLKHILPFDESQINFYLVGAPLDFSAKHGLIIEPVSSG